MGHKEGTSYVQSQKKKKKRHLELPLRCHHSLKGISSFSGDVTDLEVHKCRECRMIVTSVMIQFNCHIGLVPLQCVSFGA